MMKAYIIHVSNADRRKVHIQKQLAGKGLDVFYITDGDQKDLTASIFEKYFKSHMAQAKAATSCAYKHVLAYEKIRFEGDDISMIIEDDIRFYRNYSNLEKVLKEIRNRRLENFILSLEDSMLKYIPRSKRSPNSFIYKATKSRTAGAYLVDKAGAESLLNFIIKEKIDRPIDWFHDWAVERGIIQMFWCQPAIAVQGSHDGSLSTMIDQKKSGLLKTFSFRLQRIYKRILYWIR